MTKPLPPEKTKRRFDIVDWTEARVELLRTMFADRRSAREIAYAVHGGATRNAVLGKLHRLGLVRRSAKEIHRLSAAKNELAAFERKHAQAERQRVVSGQALAERRERQAAIGLAAVAKVEAEAAAAQRRAAGLRKFYHLPKNSPAPVEDNCPDEIAVNLPPRRYRPVLAAANPAFVARVEKPPDLYAHMRTERGYHDAIAALSR